MPYYSAKTGGFYHDLIHGEREDRPSLIPPDAVEITDNEWKRLLSSGKLIVPGPKGKPILVDQKPPEAKK